MSTMADSVVLPAPFGPRTGEDLAMGNAQIGRDTEAAAFDAAGHGKRVAALERLP
jgi:hypothetical protein